jgi:peroxiredoxin
MSNRTAHQAEAARREHLNAVRGDQARRARRRRYAGIAWAVAATVIVVAVSLMMLTSRSTTTTTAKAAPDFTLTTTTGATVRLADYRGKNVLLYFSEGAGCQSCLLQMAEIEKNRAAFDAARVTVLPIVMNTRAQITQDMQANGVSTPFLLDDGAVSTAYGVLGRGMHAGLPGHSFVLIDSTGTQRWYGEYPSMWLSPADLLTEIRTHV